MKKILIVVESIDIDDSSGSKANVALIKNLQLAGYDLKVYHYTLKNIRLPGIDCIAIKENRKSFLFLMSRTERYLRDYLNLQLHKPLQKMYGFSFTLFNDRNSIVRTLQADKDYIPDLVITLSKGGSFRPHHALLQIPKWHAKWLAYMHDPYPMHHYPKPYTWFEPGFKKKEFFVKQISEKAAFSAFPSLLLLQWMGKFYARFLETGHVIPHQIIKLDTNWNHLPEFFDPGKFNLLHAGNLLGARNPKNLVSAFINFLQIVPEAKTNSRLIFMGGNNERVRAAAAENPAIIVSESYVEFEQVYQMQKRASVNVILEAKAEVSPFLPGKLPHCIEAEKPILLLGPENSECRRLLGKEYPWWSEIDKEDEIYRHIVNLYKIWLRKRGGIRQDYAELSDYLSVPYLKRKMASLNF